MSNLRLRKLCVSLGGNAIIEDLDLEVEPGEFLVLLGPSGCGKSTLLHSIAGLTDISGGSIEIGGVDMSDADPSERGIGMVFQSYALYPTMTVEKNMSFGLRISGTPKAEIARRIARVAEMLQLGPLLQRKPAQLSGGQRQRVAIGRALVREAGVFLFDEPLSNLDAKLRAELRRELKLLHQKLGSTMVYVTHDQVEALTLATRIVVMRGGVIQQIGAPAEVYERPANIFVAGFLGAPAMNFVAGTLGPGGAFASPALSLALALAPEQAAVCDGRRVILGIRPEHVQIDGGGALPGTVTLVEPMGNHQVVWFTCGAQLLSALVHDARVFAPGQRIAFALDAARGSLFDDASGCRL
ncbi:ABC transporter ATP-binding protein [Massilia glaciei]|uniref:ABC transporter ATP-binding protein n=1 Tax=Massilia glaciei TaxID=1524097 RepID=A0A2U2HID5_9BURK|nr:ABC transporter ATP-binding protein [Massilia glaciei]PWF46097.1 ABC transporter ATP-binding protein [Massilia glaciei]